MKVAIVTGTFPSSSETFVSEIADGITQRGHYVTVFANSCGNGITAAERERCETFYGVRWADSLEESKWRKLRLLFWGLYSTGKSYSQALRLLMSLFALRLPGRLATGICLLNLARDPHEVIHVQHGYFGKAVQLFRDAGLITGEVVVTWHGSDANADVYRYGGRAYKQLFEQPFMHTVGSEFMFSRIQELGACKNTINIIPMGIDLEFFKSKFNTRNSATTKKLKIVSVGRLSEEKGHIFLLRAVARLIREGIDLEVEIIGDGPEKQRLNKERLNLGLFDKVVFSGARDRPYIRSALDRADLFVLPCVIGLDGRVESQGVAIAEAQAMSLPVVSTSVGGIPESVVHGSTGLLVEAGSIQQLVGAIRKLALDRSLLNEYSQNARNLAERRFSKNRMILEFERTYARVLGTSLRKTEDV